MHKIGTRKVFIRDPDGIESFLVSENGSSVKGAWENNFLEIDRFLSKESHFGKLFEKVEVSRFSHMPTTKENKIPTTFGNLSINGSVLADCCFHIDEKQIIETSRGTPSVIR